MIMAKKPDPVKKTDMKSQTSTTNKPGTQPTGATSKSMNDPKKKM